MNTRLDMGTYTTLQLWMIVTAAPDRKILWNRLEQAADDELARREVEAAA